MSVAWLEIAGTDETSKIERFHNFNRVFHLECLICSSYAIVYITTFIHVDFSGVTMTGTSEMDSFSIMLLQKGLCLSSCFVPSPSLTIILVLLLLLLCLSRFSW